ncbi:GIY-YIG nuclease family protein [Salibacterium salarium]|uniref:GIY-YIG nuclease family protein n=1 Tax=Salibacterium salarium TaxID=284579 RepID=A0A3R9QFQ2_9BACI|nr:GIY-YIG nuclease family protein [Salibacterium salarium]RSL29583.1 GIY-YIG nuclease family protein [Salibacterium salarium]
MKEANHYVYILECGDGTYYTGYTTDVAQRIKMHKSGKGAKYTRGRGPLRLVYQEAFATKQEAMRAEYDMKKWTRQDKEALLQNLTEDSP